MARNNFGPVMDQVYKHEGGYVDHPKDPGGATNMGITHRTLAAERGRPVTKQDVRALSRDEADEIYRRRYWQAVKADALPYGLDLVAMDGAVNSGPARGAKWLQIGVGAKADGKVGPETITKAQGASVRAIEVACDARMSFLRALRHWGTFGRGWSRRVASVEAVGTRMYLMSAHGRTVTRSGLEERVTVAEEQAQDERRAGGVQAASTGAGAGSGAMAADLSPAMISALALGVGVIVALLIWRAVRKARYHEDRREAFAAQMEYIK